MVNDKEKSVREKASVYFNPSHENYTYCNYLEWDDNSRCEIIDGKVYEMSAAPSRKHQDILLSLAAEFYTYLKGKSCKVYIAPFDVRLPEGGETDENVRNVVQPDLSVFCDENKLDNKGAKGSPDLIIEVISPSTLKKDLTIKKALYERMGVREYWIVYPMEEVIVVYCLNVQGNFGEIETFDKDSSLKVGIFDDFTINLSTIFL